MGGCCLEAEAEETPREHASSQGPLGGGWTEDRPHPQPRIPTQYFTFCQLAQATNHFSDDLVLGEGGFGRVYKGRLPNGLHVAIKRLDRRGQQGDAEFNVETDMLARLHHPNLVRLLGVCVEGMHRAAVFELQLGGCVRAALNAGAHPQLQPTPAKPIPRHVLTWHARLNVAVGAAAGLAFLHEEAIPSVIHRDVNTNNILLDETDCAAIGDLGLARSAQHWQDTGPGTATLKGTFGYVAPEYLLHGQHSQKSDVYAFGVVLLELLTGQQPVEPRRRETPGLVQHMLPKLDSIDHTQAQMDPVIRHERFSAPQLAMFTEVASACLSQQPQDRPRMSRVACELQNALDFHERVPMAMPPADNGSSSPERAMPAAQAPPAYQHTADAMLQASPADLQHAMRAPAAVEMSSMRQPTSAEHILTRAADVEWPCQSRSSNTTPAAAGELRQSDSLHGQDYEPADSRWSAAYSNPFGRGDSASMQLQQQQQLAPAGSSPALWQSSAGLQPMLHSGQNIAHRQGSSLRQSAGQLQIAYGPEHAQPWQWRSLPVALAPRSALHAPPSLPDASLDAWAPPNLSSSFQR